VPRPRHVIGQALFALLALGVLLPLYFVTHVPGSRGNAVEREHVSFRWHPPKRALLVVSALALFLAMYLFGLLPGGSSASAGPVHIENVSIHRLPQASSPRIELTVELKNHDGVPHKIQAWWLLARPGANEPWNLYAFRSSTQGPRTLAPGEKARLSWQEEVTAEPGSYELSVWVHTIEGDGTRHSDGTRLDNPLIHIDSSWSPFIRRAAPAPGLKVSAVDVAAAAEEAGLRLPTELRLIASVTNETTADTKGDVQWFLYPKASRVPWNAKPAYTSRPLQHQVFPANRETTITTGEPISLWPGEYLLRVIISDTTADDSAPGDDLFLTDAITVLENNSVSGIIRANAAPGPVEIEKLAVDMGSFQRGDGSLTVTLRNRSSSDQDIVLWWFLSRPGSLQPWVEFDVQSRVFAAEIASSRTSIVDLTDEVYLPPGTYELSVWVHTLDGEGEEAHSDGAWFNRAVEVQ
jgi:hypothetical protein